MSLQEFTKVTRASYPKHLLGFAVLLSLLLASGCGRDATGDAMIALSASPDADRAGPYIVFGGMVVAADFLDAPFENVTAVIGSPAEVVRVTDGMSLDLSQGQVILIPQAGPDQLAFGELVYQNTSTENLVLFMEPVGPDGVSQGISIVNLAPGDRYVFEHNWPPWLVRIGTTAGEVLTHTAVKATLAITLVVVIGEEVSEFIDSFGTCIRTAKFLQPDVCVGSCTGGRGCFITTFQNYGPAFMGMVEPTACACQ